MKLLFIGDDVEVTIVGVKGNQVRIENNALKDVSVVREELLDGDSDCVFDYVNKMPAFFLNYASSLL